MSFVTYLSYQQVLTWAILGGTALFDRRPGRGAFGLGFLALGLKRKVHLPGMGHDLVLADAIAIAAFQLAENDGRKDGQCAQNQERVVNALNHLRRA